MGLLRRRKPQGMPRDFGWGYLHPGLATSGRGVDSNPDTINQLPRIPRGVLWASTGQQLWNGVAGIDSGFQTPTASGIPYWQLTRQASNPPVYTSNGGAAQVPMDGAVASQMAASTLGRQPSGYIAGPGRLAPGVTVNGES